MPYRYESASGYRGKDEAKLLNWLSGSRGHLVLGDPGIGKSTLISWYLSTERKARVYQLSEFKLNGQEGDFGDTLLEKMGATREQLRTTVLFLDGLDECGLSPEDRYRFLEQLQERWGDAFPWVVTCRLNYITPEDSQTKMLRLLRGITLLPLDEEQIGDFLERYHKASGKEIPDEKRQALISEQHKGEYGSPYGIPLLLYVVAAFPEVKVTENSTLVDAYDQLFPTLFERKYESHKHPIVGNIQEELEQMSRDIALYMLLHNSDAIPDDDYREIEQVFGGTIPADAGRFGNYFRAIHHTKGKSELCFIHRTMYEYFVADGFVHLAVSAATPKELSGVIAWYWHQEQMGDTLQQYVKEKLGKQKAKLVLSFWEEAGLELMNRGFRRCWRDIQNHQTARKVCVTPNCMHPDERETLTEDRIAENVVFCNLCYLLAWVREIIGCNRRIYEGYKDKSLLTNAISNASGVRCLLLSNFDLSGELLWGTDLSGVKLAYADLSRADLTRADLIEADMSYAILTRTDFTRADLTGANLAHADLTCADLTNADLTSADLSDAILWEVETIGYTLLAICRFDRIKVKPLNRKETIYTRRQFFSRYFPNHPYPGDKPK